MIVKLTGKLIEKKDISVIVDVNGMAYEVLVPLSVLKRVDDHINDKGEVSLITYHYLQLSPSAGIPLLVGFLNELERDFFLQFIKVSGIGPRAAVKALNKPIADITQAIQAGDVNELKTLPGIGLQRAKEVVAKLQGKIGKFGLIQDQSIKQVVANEPQEDWQKEALDVLLQLQYKKPEAQEMIKKAMDANPKISSSEELLNQIYNNRVS